MSVLVVQTQLEIDLGALPGERTLTSYAPATEVLGEDPEPWRNVGRKLAVYSRATPWWIADWALAGEATYGDVATQFLDELGQDYAKVSKLLHVARRIPPEIRRSELTFSHHEIVATVEGVEEQRRWLDRAVDEHLTRDELRDLVRGKEPTEASEDAKPRAALSKARQDALREKLEAVAAKWWNGLARERGALDRIRKDGPARAHEFTRLARLSVTATMKFLEHGEA